MCVLVSFSSRVTLPIYDAAAGTITLPSPVSHAHAVTALRAVLAELAVVQPPFGARCWCGEPVDPLPRVPRQQRSDQVISYGS